MRFRHCNPALCVRNSIQDNEIAWFELYLIDKYRYCFSDHNLIFLQK